MRRHDRLGWTTTGSDAPRGGLTPRIHLATEQRQKPLSLLITAGHRHDSPQFHPVLEVIRVPRTGPGRPHTTPDKVRADKAYGSRGGRPRTFDEEDYKERRAWL
ncbi:transposase [Streptomyces sp. ME18-1-4]|uniref:transposase n=1 Tax=Streptomyces sp. ME18-1-4 TaxID=3028685 RepID=UPI0029B8EB22|nr:transposase [Streptomyces sp. ME18-1-4]MDX3242919.1 transposase [Streptomyces sp. ME18-1-4]